MKCVKESLSKSFKTLINIKTALFICSIVIILYQGLAYAKKTPVKTTNFIYPLKRIYYIASTFGEHRENHFHAGIDFTTRMQIGEPVYAVNDGAIFRIKYQYRGYGKVLYIKHKNDIISVYAHLDRFENDILKLEDILRSYQEKEGKKYVDIYFDDGAIPVKKGQLIAYSGETGEGLPHLHFELRKGEDTPINPFDSFYHEAKDKTPPKIQGFILCPDDIDSYINGVKSCQIITLRKKNNIYRSDSEPTVEGKFKLYVSAFDRAESIYWREPLLFKFSIDGNTTFIVKNSFFSFDENKFFGFLHDQGMHGYEYFNIPIEICNPNAEKLSMVKLFNKKLCNLNMPEGKHTLKLVAEDANKNISIAELNINVKKAKKINFAELMENEEICIQILHDKSFQNFSKDSVKIQYWDFINNIFKDYNGEIENAKCGLKIKTPLFDSKNYYIRISYYDKGQWSPWYIKYQIDDINTIKKALSINESNKLEEWNTIYGKNFISLSNNFSKDMPVMLQGKCYHNRGESNLNIRYNLDGSTIANINTDIDSKIIRCFLKEELTGTKWEYSWFINFAKAYTSNSLQWDDVSMIIPAGSILEDTNIWLEEFEPRNAELLPIIGKIKQFHPRGLYFPNRALIKVPVPNNITSFEKLSLYRWHRKENKWKVIISHFDKSDRSINGYIHYLDRIALILDNAKPIFYPLVPYPRQIFKTSPTKFIIRAYEKGMGINEDSISVYLDSEKIESEYDPDRDIIQIKLRQPLTSGNHTLKIEAKDYANNQADPLSIDFIIK